MGVIENLDYFISNNDYINDVAIYYILTELRKNIENPNSRRVRCLGHIINLASKAFLFEKDADTFKVKTNTAR
jgi:hypothetical protein